MLKRIIKRDGSIEEFTPHKLNKWAEWSSATLGDRVDWSSVVMDTVKAFGEEADSQDLQKQLVKNCLLKKDWPHNLMAGKLYAAIVRKELYSDKIPNVKELHMKLFDLGLMSKLNYTDEDYEVANFIIDHSRDFDMAQFQIKQITKKYAIQDRVTEEGYETPQFTFMRMALALAEDEPVETRMEDTRDWYNLFSKSIVNAPSPNYLNLGTKHNAYASCCLYTTGDAAGSLAIGDHIAYTMTYMSAGIGGLINTRSVGDSIRNGAIEHRGKLPYFTSLAGAVKANLQGGRGGACTTYYSAFDPEAPTITMLQNPRSTKDKQNRDIHFSMLCNRLLGKKVARNENVFQFTSFNAPKLWKLMFSGDQDGFEKYYNELENDPTFKKTYTSARQLVIDCITQGYEVGTQYLSFIDEMNRHTPFLESIYSSNLCDEISEPTAPYYDMRDLYTNDDVGYIKIKFEFLNSTDSVNSLHCGCFGYNEVLIINNQLSWAGNLKAGDIYEKTFTYHDTSLVTKHIVKEVIEVKIPGEVALCSLGAINVANINSDEEARLAARYTLKMIDKCIHKSEYVLPHVGYTAKNRLNAGIGMIGVAYEMAKRGVKYDTPEGLAVLHELAERHAYFLIEQSIELGKELGNAPWIHKTKWPQGWLPIDTYKKTVDQITPPVYKYDWEALRAKLIENGGMRFSCLIAHMPTESSSKASGATNGPYPVRELDMKKTDLTNALDWCAPDGDLLANEYQLAYEIKSIAMIKGYAVLQKFTDQAISADLYKDRRDGTPLNTDDMIEEFLAMIKYGMKGRYYQNSLVSSQQKEDKAEVVTEEEITFKIAECVGGCTL